MYPIIKFTRYEDLPTEGTFFVLAGNGMFLLKNSGICKCITPISLEEVCISIDPITEEMQQNMEVNLPKIPAKTVWKVKEFFRLVVEKYRAESEINLYYNPETQDYKIHVPDQTVSHGSVNYRRIPTMHLPEMDGYRRVGTIHSHCDFGAFHSGTDVHDEADTDGLHVTFGHNHKDEFTITSSIVINGRRKLIDPLLYLDGIEQKGDFYNLASFSDQEIEQMSEEAEGWLEKVQDFSVSPQNLLHIQNSFAELQKQLMQFTSNSFVDVSKFTLAGSRIDPIEVQANLLPSNLPINTIKDND